LKVAATGEYVAKPQAGIPTNPEANAVRLAKALQHSKSPWTFARLFSTLRNLFSSCGEIVCRREFHVQTVK